MPPAGNDILLGRYPPVVIATTPEAGRLDVEPTTDTLTVEFSKPMTDGVWAWVSVDDRNFSIEQLSYTSPTSHVAQGVVLEAGQAYRMWLNDPYDVFSAFADQRGRPLVPWPYAFATGGEATLDDIDGAVVQTVPVAGTDGVDPSLTRIEARFSKAVDPDSVSWTPDDPETALDIVDQGVEGTTAFADVALAPGTTYAVWVGARDLALAQTAPYLLTFRTQEP